MFHNVNDQKVFTYMEWKWELLATVKPKLTVKRGVNSTSDVKPVSNEKKHSCHAQE